MDEISNTWPPFLRKWMLSSWVEVPNCNLPNYKLPVPSAWYYLPNLSIFLYDASFFLPRVENRAELMCMIQCLPLIQTVKTYRDNHACRMTSQFTIVTRSSGGRRQALFNVRVAITRSLYLSTCPQVAFAFLSTSLIWMTTKSKYNDLVRGEPIRNLIVTFARFCCIHPALSSISIFLQYQTRPSMHATASGHKGASAAEGIVRTHLYPLSSTREPYRWSLVYTFKIPREPLLSLFIC